MRQKHTGKKRKIAIPLIVLSLLIIISCVFFYSLFSRYTRNEQVVSVLPPLAGIVDSPKKGAYLGVSLYDQNITTLLDLEKTLNKHFAIVGIYQSWEGTNTQFDTQWAQTISDNKSIPLITWEPWVPVTGYDRSEDKVDQEKYRLSRITAGFFDPYIKHYADEVRDYRQPVMIRFAHEMNGNWYPWGSTFNTPEDYIGAWRHVHTIFRQEGAVNATWVWSPNAIYTDPHVPYADQIKEFYPGDAYVDWVGFSAFNWAGKYRNNVWTDPEDLFSPTVAVLNSLHKPIMITETASADTNSSNDKVMWIHELAAYLQTTPQIKGVIWFNTTDNGINWQITSTEASAHAFSESITNYFLQSMTPDMFVQAKH